MSSNQFEVIIVGGGVIGLSTAYYLTRAGKSVLVLEQFEFGHQQGSSGGQSRLFRVMHSDAVLLLLAQSAYRLWLDLEAEAGEPLLKPCAALFYGTESSALTAKLNLARTGQLMAQVKAPYKQFDAPGLLKTFPIFRSVPDDYLGLLDESAALLRADAILRLLYNRSLERGASILAGETVRLIDCQANGQVKVTTAQGSYQARKIILAPGAWTNEVLASLQPVTVQLNLTLLQLDTAYFAVDDTFADAPMWYEFGRKVGENEGLFYGFPPFEQPGQLKGGADFARKEHISTDHLTHQPDPAILSYVQQHFERRFHGLNPEPIPGTVSTCLYTMTPDSYFILDFIPGCDNALLFCGGSGQAFKFAPLIGLMLTELALTGASGYNRERFSIKRPGVIQAASSRSG